jgi:hypothetical protein
MQQISIETATQKEQRMSGPTTLQPRHLLAINVRTCVKLPESIKVFAHLLHK